ncbi:MAG: universal stress protein [Acidobacteria bacterium]|nr:universal stress protein [Acidobacteriota bacterium]
MAHAPAVLCPVDFSTASRGALRYAAAVAEHFGSALLVLTVSDPLLTEVAELQMGAAWLEDNVETELRRFVDETLGGGRAVTPELIATTGKAPQRILDVARDRGVDLVVMSSHGLTGIRKLFFGATTERVLRETDVPVLVTPAADEGPGDLDELKGTGRPVLVPVELSVEGVASRQLTVAAAVCQALDVPLLFAHVVEPLRIPVPVPMSLPNVDAERRTRAESLFAQLTATLPAAIKREALVAYGDPAEEIAKIAKDRHAGLIVMGLHATSLTGPRMGSVTYRVLCLAPTVVLALPPASPAA